MDSEDESIEAAVYRYVRVSNTKRRIEQDESSRKLTKCHNDDEEDEELRDESPSTNKLNISQRVEKFHQILPNVTASTTKGTVTKIRSYVPFDTIVQQTKDEVKQKITTPSKRFSKQEDEIIDNFIDRYCEYEDMTIHEFKSFLWPKPDSSMRPHKFTQFWKFIYSIFNYRSQPALYNHIRRRYNNFKRGRWDAEEVTKLRHFIDGYGDHNGDGTPWSTIGYLLKRLPDDCKDFWRHYKKVHNQVKNTKKWTEEEETLLTNIIVKGFQNKDYRISDNICWNDVSKIMKGTKTSEQCNYKWKQIKKKNIDWFSQFDIDYLLRFLEENLDKVKEKDQIDWEKLSKIGKEQWTPIQLELGYIKYIKDIK